MSTDIVSVFRAPIELEEYWSEIHQNIDSLDVKVQQVAERLLPSYRDLQVKVSSGMSSTFRFFLQETLMTCQNRFRGTVLDGSDDLSTSLVVSWQTQEHQGRGPYAAMSGLGRTTGRTLHPDRKSTCPPVMSLKPSNSRSKAGEDWETASLCSRASSTDIKSQLGCAENLSDTQRGYSQLHSQHAAQKRPSLQWVCC